MTRNSSVDKAQVIQVICVEAIFGNGLSDDPTRLVTEYWSLDGKLLARVDGWKEKALYELLPR